MQPHSNQPDVPSHDDTQTNQPVVRADTPTVNPQYVPPTKKKSRKSVVVIFLFVVVLGVAAIGFAYVQHKQEQSSLFPSNNDTNIATEGSPLKLTVNYVIPDGWTKKSETTTQKTREFILVSPNDALIINFEAKRTGEFVLPEVYAEANDAGHTEVTLEHGFICDQFSTNAAKLTTACLLGGIRYEISIDERQLAGGGAKFYQEFLDAITPLSSDEW